MTTTDTHANEAGGDGGAMPISPVSAEDEIIAVQMEAVDAELLADYERDAPLRAFAAACTSPNTPDVSRLDWLSSLLGSIEDGTFAKDFHEDPDAVWTAVRESRALVTDLRAAMAAANGGGEGVTP